MSVYVIITADEICREYRASRSRKAAYFLMRLCASYDTVRQIYLALSILFTRCLALSCKASGQYSDGAGIRLLAVRQLFNEPDALQFAAG